MRPGSGTSAVAFVLIVFAHVVDASSPPATRADASPTDRECVARLRPGAFDTDRRAPRPAVLERLRAAGLEGAIPLRTIAPAAAADAARTSRVFADDPSGIVCLRAADRTTRDAAIERLRDDPAIEWIEPNRARESLEFPWDRSLPSDPLMRDTRQWPLWNAGPAGVYRGVAGADVGARDAWAITCGSNGVLLAIADTGVDPAHPDLSHTLPDGSERLAFGINVTTLSGVPWADSNAHGTAVAGVMAALTDDGPHFDSLGVAGVCGGDGRDNAGCRLIPIRITYDAGNSSSSFAIAQAIVWATDHGARAMNLSFGGGGGSRVERMALMYAITHGCVVVASSGNRGHLGPGVVYPAAFSANGLCVSVGASDANDRRAAFSSYGAGLDLVAPGLDVWTTAPTYPNAFGARYPGYLAGSGTSFAAPHVTGAIGLLASIRPDLMDTDAQRILCATAHDVGAPGRDDETGWGRLDVAAALRAVRGDSGTRMGLWHDERAAVVRSTGRFGGIAAGADTFGTFDHLGAWRGTLAECFEATVTIALPDSFDDDASVWPRVGGTTTLAGEFRVPWWLPWAEIAERRGRTVTLRGYLYRFPWIGPAGLDPAPDTADAWLPLPPDQARIGFTVFGRLRDVAATPAHVVPPATALRASPNPARGLVRLTGPAGAIVTVTDIAGRRVREIALDGMRGAATWDARDRSGHRVRPGVYLLRAGAAPGPAIRVVVLDDFSP